MGFHMDHVIQPFARAQVHKSEVQRFRGSEVQRFRGSEVRYRDMFMFTNKN